MKLFQKVSSHEAPPKGIILYFFCNFLLVDRMRILIPSKKQALQEAAGGPSLKPAEDICAIFYYQLIYDVFVVSPF
jgi:hypothetical protein